MVPFEEVNAYCELVLEQHHLPTSYFQHLRPTTNDKNYQHSALTWLVSVVLRLKERKQLESKEAERILDEFRELTKK